ncbi:integrin alpha-L-like [Fundulus heteroclitus]|uniref:integrin alpha-L-like n=1 Tax=Fundulus heteroclitus TaxID=8078 RepID=UPI00165A704F|nr:integrin alpha-L-like [Fundulus heteroclitus]
MYDPQRFYLLFYMALAATTIPVSSGFNIDTANPTVHSGDPEHFFGYKVLQYMSPRNKGIIVTAPLRLNGSGGIFKHDQDETEKWFSPNDSSETYPHTARHLGLSLAADSTRTRFIACSPSLAHPCDENVYLNSLCYNVTNEFQQLSSFTPLFQKCTKKAVDLVFLFDGSERMTGAEFNENKIFIKTVMKSLKNTTVKCASVQFSTDCRKVFDFNDYVAGTAIKKLDEEQHMKALTNTHKALKFTLSEILENQAAGASKDATKAVVIITDGDPSDLDTRLKSVETYERKKIIRIVIGVKNVALDNLKKLASEPKEKNVFQIENYWGLQGLLENLQKQIFTIEGFNVSRADKLTNEMSQSGFSAVSHKDTLILGSVGSNSWRGALNEPQKQDKKILDPNMQDDSYMGYSLSVGERNGKPLYFTGAPRFNHMGQVIVFQPDDDDWKPVQRITEDQVGSYFGAELCSVDIDSDGNTDFLLVGAPQFYLAEEKKEGMIYVYSLSDEMKLQKVFQVRAPSMGRFGTTISSLSDLNGDGLRDVAVGAPLEEDNTGAVYIYLGHGGVGMRYIFSQRITGADFSPRLRFFGQAINGDIDLGDDRLPDIVVGSKGSAVVLRSKSVLNVKTSLSFYPNVISIQEINCLEENEILPMVTVRACFEMAEATNSTAEKRINISVMLNVDSTRSLYRGFFNENKKSRNTTHTYELTGRDTCFNYFIYMNKCVKDTLSPVEINLNFSQPDAENASAILNVDSYTRAVVKVPFERHCAKKEICIADLKVDFNFMKGEVLVTENTVFSVLIRLDNIGDDSYNTSLTMHYSPGLSFSIMELTGTKKLTYICTGLEDVPDKTVCGISLPVYRSKSSATFNATFRVARDFEWNETLSMSVSAQSENSNSSEPVSVTKASRVTYAVKLAMAVNDKTVTHMNFTPETHEPKTMAIIYNINNTGFKDFPINVSLFFPSKLEHNFEVKNYKVIVEQNKTQCSVISNLKPEDCPLKENCIAMKCDTFTLKNYSGVQFTLEGLVHFQNLKNHNTPFLKQYTGDGGEVSFKSFIKVHYDGAKYIVTSHKNENNKGSYTVKESKASVLVEFIVPPNKLLIILTGVILGMMLLILLIFILCKRGFFKRKTIQDYEEQEAELSAQNGCLSESSHEVEQAEEENELLNEAANKPEQAEEEKEPLNEDEKKDSLLTISE